MKKIQIIISGLLFFSCTSRFPGPDEADVKQQIVEVEHNFAKMAADSGIDKAFIFYAAPDAVLKRGNLLIKGRDSIAVYLEAANMANDKLLWEPDYVDVASSGDLAYTYGRFVYFSPDSTGNLIEQHGFFHTVWKRMPDGNWKFVWD
ncbi:MAG: hypothetical protein H6541_04545 [Lentimicrobiaceae bacterium]|nr:hypothetical protein [Lentimicrobiaceae bacterium]MCO5265113.1 hypothetical protein [Lentimicrobium sp.]HPG33451.1 hypothetical protein [Lentimicrobium sp.]